MLTVEQINELYNILDLYIVASRVEGGPQAILECGITKTLLSQQMLVLLAKFFQKSPYLICKILKKQNHLWSMLTKKP